MNTLIEEVVSQTINKYVNENCSEEHKGPGTLCPFSLKNPSKSLSIPEKHRIFADELFNI